MDQSQSAPPPEAQVALNEPTARVLTWGFRISAALLLIGIVVSAVQGEELHESVADIPTIIEQILDGNGAGIVALGILVMIATPIAATLSVVLSCLRIGDRRYAIIASAVLIILFISAASSAL
ncbi:MAG TPA: DUF1634 domain-containing protein [Thermomicrobiales bacterium]|nr:DUF1634 domain-containing protein [Thermomicrobiales bacterium]